VKALRSGHEQRCNFHNRHVTSNLALDIELVDHPKAEAIDASPAKLELTPLNTRFCPQVVEPNRLNRIFPLTR
jgi:hypothetical protein